MAEANIAKLDVNIDEFQRGFQKFEEIRFSYLAIVLNLYDLTYEKYKIINRTNTLSQLIKSSYYAFGAGY